jgi:hypothetical protein
MLRNNVGGRDQGKERRERVVTAVKYMDVLIPEGTPIGVLICALAIGLAVGTLLGAVFLRVGVALCNKAIALNNKMAGVASSLGSVPEPAFGKAMWITFEISMLQMVAGFLIFGVFPGDGTGARGRIVDVAAQLLLVPVGFLITVGVLSAKLPTTFGRAILVTLCDMLLILLVGGVLVGIAVLVLGIDLR